MHRMGPDQSFVKPEGAMLRESVTALWDCYDLAMLDLDGVVYVGRHAIPDVPQVLAAATEAGMSLAYITNNASRPPSTVAEHLRELGIAADSADVVTSAQAAARLVSEEVPAGSRIFVIGGRGLFVALDELDLVPVQDMADEPVAVVSGFDSGLLWRTVMDGAMLVRAGLPWVASNTDLTVPTAQGIAPGNGVLVAAVAGFAGREPVVAGKPRTPLFDETRLRVGGRRPLVVGDRLDTDIEGARNAGLDSLLVLTGVTGLTELVSATPRQRPSYVALRLDGLGRPHAVPTTSEGVVRLAGWTGRVGGDDELLMDGAGSGDDWWRVAAVTAWNHLDATGRAVDTSAVRVPGSVGAEQDTGNGVDGADLERRQVDSG